MAQASSSGRTGVNKNKLDQNIIHTSSWCVGVLVELFVCVFVCLLVVCRVPPVSEQVVFDLSMCDMGGSSELFSFA